MSSTRGVDCRGPCLLRGKEHVYLEHNGDDESLNFARLLLSIWALVANNLLWVRCRGIYFELESSCNSFRPGSDVSSVGSWHRHGDGSSSENISKLFGEARIEGGNCTSLKTISTG